MIIIKRNLLQFLKTVNNQDIFCQDIKRKDTLTTNYMIYRLIYRNRRVSNKTGCNCRNCNGCIFLSGFG